MLQIFLSDFRSFRSFGHRQIQIDVIRFGYFHSYYKFILDVTTTLSLQTNEKLNYSLVYAQLELSREEMGN